MVESAPLYAPQPPASKPAAAKAAPEPLEPVQSEELTQALRAFAPLPVTPAAAQPEPAEPVKVAEVAREAFAFEAPAPEQAPSGLTKSLSQRYPSQH